MTQTFLERKLVSGRGGGKSGGSARVAKEAPNTLRSRAIARFIDLVSEGEIGGLVNGDKSVFFNKIQAANEDGTTNFSGFTYKLLTGLSDQPYLEGFEQITAEYNVALRVRQDQAAEWVTNSGVLDGVIVTVNIPALTQQNKENGDMNGWHVGLAVDVRNVSTGGQWVQKVHYDHIQGKNTSPYERSYNIVLDGGPGQYAIRVRRLSADNDNDVSIQDKLYFQRVTEVIDQKMTYADSAVVGVTIDSEQFGTSIPERAYEIYGMKCKYPSNYDPVARTYTGFWNGTWNYGWCNNPAWVFMAMATHPRYGAGIPEMYMDKWGLYDLARYCDESVPDGYGGQEPRFVFNGTIASREEAYRVLQGIASMMRAIVFYAAGAVITRQDRPYRDEELLSFTKANVKGVFNYSSTAKRARHTSANAQFVNPKLGYEKDFAFYEDRAAIMRYGHNPMDIAAYGTTSRGQAYRLAKWAVLTDLLQTESVQFVSGVDASGVLPGDIIEVADPHLATADFGGRIVSISADGKNVVLDREISFAGATTPELHLTLINGPVDDVYNPGGPQQTDRPIQRELRHFESAISAYDNVTRTVTLVNPVPGSQTIGVAYDFNFENSTGGGWGLNPEITATPSDTGLVLTNKNSGDGYIFKNGLSIDGAKYTKIVIDFERTAATASWDGTVYYGNGTHSVDGAYRKNFPDCPVGERRTVVLDMSNLTQGGGDWVAGIINTLRIDFDGSNTGTVKVHSIKVLQDEQNSTVPLIWVFSKEQLKPRLFKVFDIEERSGDGIEFKISAINFSAEKFLLMDENFSLESDEDDNYSDLPSTTGCEPPTDLNAGFESFYQNGALTIGLNIDWQPSPDRFLRGYKVSYRRNMDDWTDIDELVRTTNISIKDALPGRYEIVVRAQNQFSALSQPLTTTIAVNGSEATGLDLISNIVTDRGNTTFTGRNINVQWLAKPISRPGNTATFHYRNVRPGVGVVDQVQLPALSGASFSLANAQPGDQLEITIGLDGFYHKVAAGQTAEQAAEVLKQMIDLNPYYASARNGPDIDIILQNKSDASDVSGENDPYFLRYKVIVRNSVSGNVIRTEYTNTPAYVYTYEMNLLDNTVPQRSVRFDISVEDIRGNYSNTATATLYNPPPVLTVPEASAGYDGFTLRFTAPTDPDYVGTIVWASPAPGVAPIEGNRKYKAAGNPFVPGVPGGTYYYKYAMYDAFSETDIAVSSEQSITLSLITSVEFDTTPPEVPTGLNLTSTLDQDANGVQTITLRAQWAVNTEPDLDGYEIGLTPNGGYETVYPVSVVSSFPWTAIANTLYTARIRSVDKTGNRSGWSGNVTHTTTRDTVAPTVPTNVSANPLFDSILISATAPVAADTAAIRVYESTSNVAETASLIATMPAVAGRAWTYQRGGVGNGATRYYWLAAEDSSGNVSTLTSAVSATARGLGVVDFTPGVEPTVTVDALPSTGNYYGRMVRLTTTGRLYTWNNSQVNSGIEHWSYMTPANDIAGQLTSDQISSLSSGKILGQLTSDQIQSLSTAKLAGQLTSDQIVDLSAAKIAGQLTSAQIADLAAAKISGQLTSAQIESLSAAKIAGLLSSDQIQSLSAAKLAGQLSSEQIQNLAAAKIAGAIQGTQIAENSITTAHLIANAITADKILAGSIISEKIATGAILAEKIAAGAIITEKLAANAVTAEKIIANAITAEKILAGSIITEKLAANAVTAEKIIANAITAEKILAGSIISEKIATGAILAEKIAAGAITTEKLDAGAVTAEKILANAVTADKILAGAITTIKLSAGAVTADKILAGSITASKLNIGDLTNVFVDPNQSDTSIWFKHTAPDAFQFRHNGAFAGNFAWAIPPASTLKVMYSPDCTVDPGRSYFFSSIAALTVSDGGAVRVLVEWYFYDANADNLSYISNVGIINNSTGIQNRVTAILTAPSNANRVRFMYVRDGGGTGTGVFFEPIIRRASGGELIVDGAIKANHIEAASITGDRIQAGTIGASLIAAKAITVDKLAVASSDNLMPNGMFISEAFGSLPLAWSRFQRVGSDTIRVTIGDSSWPVLKMLELNRGDGGYSELSAWSDPIPFEDPEFFAKGQLMAMPGDEFYVESQVFSTSANIAAMDVVGKYQAGNLATAESFALTDYAYSSVSQNSVVINAGGFRKSVWSFRFTGVTPAKIGLRFRNLSPTPGAFVMLGNVILRRRNKGELIVDGSIRANHIEVGSITGDRIQGGTITGNLIAGQTITANNLLVVGSNLNPDPHFQDEAFWFRDGTAPNNWYFEGIDPANGFYTKRVTLWEGVSPGTARRHVYGTNVNKSLRGVVPLSWYRLKARFWNASNQIITVTAQLFDINNNHIGDISVGSSAMSGQAVIESAPIRAPFNTYWYRYIIYNESGSNFTGAVSVGEIELTQASDGKLIVDGSIKANHIEVGSITGDRIGANQITGVQIAGQSITARNLAIGNFDNIIPDGGMRDPSFWDNGAGKAVLVDASGAWNYPRLLAFSNPGAFDVYSRFWNVEIPANYRISYRLYTGDMQSGGWFQPLIHVPAYQWQSILKSGPAGENVGANSIGDVSNNDGSYYGPGLDTGYQSYNFYNPPGVTESANRQIQFRFIGNFQGTVYMQIKMVRIGDQTLIADGAITTNKIQANAITADKMSVNSLSAISANLGTITAGSININGRFIVDGSGNVTITSASSGARLTVSNSLIQVFDANNVLRVRMGIW